MARYLLVRLVEVTEVKLEIYGGATGLIHSLGGLIFMGTGNGQKLG